MPPTTMNQQTENPSVLYPQNPTLTPHRPTRPTAVVPPLPKDPNVSSPVGSYSNAPSTNTIPSNYQQTSPQKSSNREPSYSVQQVRFYFVFCPSEKKNDTCTNDRPFVFLLPLSIKVQKNR